jgi:hypothetical protein
MCVHPVLPAISKQHDARPKRKAAVQANANSGDANVQFCLGLVYQAGQIVPRDYSKGFLLQFFLRVFDERVFQQPQALALKFRLLSIDFTSARSDGVWGDWGTINKRAAEITSDLTSISEWLSRITERRQPLAFPAPERCT